ncbi:unnamed protein product [Strongylus vulgaris]|uniref:Uncharacterized protein n=1 Tax=Strongylus vulgaris TaxID=40348 RepID=A0A3P7JJ36_STRVU|nr:unnamed protein product [Strongylus vulgaris]
MRSDRGASRKERKVIDSATAILREALHDSLEIEVVQDSVIEKEEDPLWSGDDDKEPKVDGKASIRFGNRSGRGDDLYSYLKKDTSD